MGKKNPVKQMASHHLQPQTRSLKDPSGMAATKSKTLAKNKLSSPQKINKNNSPSEGRRGRLVSKEEAGEKSGAAPGPRTQGCRDLVGKNPPESFVGKGVRGSRGRVRTASPLRLSSPGLPFFGGRFSLKSLREALTMWL